jgi:hypothetical protein
LCGADRASAQPVTRPEVGAHATVLRIPPADATDVGLGARVGWPVTGLLAIETLVDVTLTGADDVVAGGRKLHVLAGPTVGWRNERVGVFAFGRGGLARVGEGQQDGACVAIFPPPESCLTAENRLAFSLGGGAEVFPSTRTAVRADVASIAARLSPSSNRFDREGDYAQDVQFSVGLAFRF